MQGHIEIGLWAPYRKDRGLHILGHRHLEESAFQAGCKDLDRSMGRCRAVRVWADYRDAW
jgi:hypothetical protein